eukprot:306274-Chlamydomonas_euryale.AAC.1
MVEQMVGWAGGRTHARTDGLMELVNMWTSPHTSPHLRLHACLDHPQRVGDQQRRGAGARSGGHVHGGRRRPPHAIGNLRQRGLHLRIRARACAH